MGIQIAMQWTVRPDGYRWEPARNGGLVLRTQDEGDSREPRRVNIAGKPALFFELAQLENSQEAFLGFANHYGPLTRFPHVQKGLGGNSGETLEFWQRQVAAMRQATDLWDRIRAKDVKVLESKIRWQTDANGIRRPFFHDEPDLKFKLRRNPITLKRTGRAIPEPDGPEGQPGFQEGDILGPARSYLALLVNTQLKQFVRDSDMVDPTAPSLKWSASQGFSLQIRPNSLIQCLWLQLAQAISGYGDYPACLRCGKRFEISSKAARKSRRYCSDACKSGSLRDRKKEAIALSKDGRSTNWIAKKLKSNDKTIRKWLAEDGGQRSG